MHFFFRQESTPRWIIFMNDVGICLFSLALAYLLRFNFSIPEKVTSEFYFVFSITLVVRAATFYFFRTYAGIIRYTSTVDALRVCKVVTYGSVVFCVINIVRFYGFDGKFLIPFSVIIIDYLTTMFLLVSIRVAVKTLYLELKNPTKQKSNVLIFGAGEAGIITKHALDRDEGTKYKVIGFVDDSKQKAGNNMEGIRIYLSDKLNELLINNEIAHLVISVQNISVGRKREIIEKCLQYNVSVLNVPPVSSWINGELSFNQIRNIRIEDLLGRDPIKLDEENIRKQLKGKMIMVTGAAGSIGSELVRQIMRFQPQKIILLDQAESPLYELEFELQTRFNAEKFEIVIGDIREQQRMENLFRTFKPQIVYHAAAYKHVPLMENNPSESIRTNVMGTKIIVDLAVKHGVEKFVMISTDKAVNPTNVMGASKRIAEIYAQSLNKNSVTKFITTRFGNVLGSNGSVIPLFRRQIEKGGPITVTDPNVTRYFMTIPESCQLVLEAGAMGEGGEIFIFDMGDSVKIIDLAKKMIKLAGLELGKDIEIKFTGLRPGEKLYEELLANEENTLPTHHPQIMKGRVREYGFEEIADEIKGLISLYEMQNNEKIVKKLKNLIPEYISNNSVYTKLDLQEEVKEQNSL